MKSERRHELETNTLAMGLARFPYYMQQYGSRILLAVVLVILVAVFLFQRSSYRREAARAALDNLSIAREAVEGLRSYSPLLGGRGQTAEQKRDAFKLLLTEAETALTRVNDNSKDPTILAEALVTRGDLNWVLATYPALPEATTRPTELTLVADRNAHLDNVSRFYNDVLRAYPDNDMATLSAHMGLAALAENKSDWAVAEQHYRAVADDQRYPQAFRDQARKRLDSLSTIRQPVLLADRAARSPSSTAPSTTAAGATAPSATAPDNVKPDNALPAGPLGPSLPLEQAPSTTQHTAESTVQASPAPATAPATQPTR